MINGNIDEFMDKLWSGEELIYTYNGKKYFSQGYIMDDGKYRFELQRWEPDADILWKTEGLSNQDSLEAFLKEPLFDGKTFWEVEKEIEWVDYKKKPLKCYQRLRGVSEDTNILQTSNKIISYMPWSSQWENTFEKINFSLHG